MKETLYRVLPYAALAMDLLTLWANATHNDWITLENLHTQLSYCTGHLLDVWWCDWLFDCLQSLPTNTAISTQKKERNSWRSI